MLSSLVLIKPYRNISDPKLTKLSCFFNCANFIPPSVNPLSPKSDQHQISPCNINALYNRVVMRIRDMITQDEFA